jgi:hypothetical protein
VDWSLFPIAIEHRRVGRDAQVGRARGKCRWGGAAAEQSAAIGSSEALAQRAARS